MVERELDDRILRRRQHLANLALPDLPRVAAPEIVGPEEAALQQVVAQVAPTSSSAKIGGPDFRHHDERALEQLVIGRAARRR